MELSSPFLPPSSLPPCTLLFQSFLSSCPSSSLLSFFHLRPPSWLTRHRWRDADSDVIWQPMLKRLLVAKIMTDLKVIDPMITRAAGPIIVTAHAATPR